MRLMDIFYFIEGNLRYLGVKLFGDVFMRRHIREQVGLRYLHVDRECIGSGSCKICGCSMPAMLYCSKSCDKPCYPRLMGVKEWGLFKENGGDAEWELSCGFVLRRRGAIYE